MAENISSILVVRSDKIGDVVLTTPAIAALRKKYPEAKITGVVSTTASEVYRSNPHLNGSIILDPQLYSGFFGFWRLVRRLRAEKADAAVVFHDIGSGHYRNGGVGFVITMEGGRAGLL